MKTAQEWINHYDKSVPDNTYAPEGFVLKFFEQVQTDARTDLLERIKSLECENKSAVSAMSDFQDQRNDLRVKLNSLQGELNVYRAQSLQMQQEMEELRGIIERALNTGSIRVDEHKQLFLDANRVLGRNPK